MWHVTHLRAKELATLSHVSAAACRRQLMLTSVVNNCWPVGNIWPIETFLVAC